MIPKNTLFPYFCTRDVAGGAEFCKLRSDIAEIKKLNKGRMFLVCFSFSVDFYLDPKNSVVSGIIKYLHVCNYTLPPFPENLFRKTCLAWTFKAC